MTHLKRTRPRIYVDSPIIESYSVVRDLKFFGFKTKIAWKYNNPNVIAFRVYKAKLSKPLLQKKYEISTLALQRLTALKSFPIQNTILYNKSVILQNSKLKFNSSDSNRFDMKEGPTSTYNYKQVALIRANKNGVYEFTDKNVKFGETCAYVVTALTLNLVESKRSMPVLVTVEDIKPPKKPVFFKAEQLSSGVLLTMGSDDDDVVAFDVYRKEEDEYIFMDRIKKPQREGFINYLDLAVYPAKTYTYKVYAVDLFDNISYEANFDKVTYDILFPHKQDISIPKLEVARFKERLVLKTFKESELVTGAVFERQDVWRKEKGFSQKSNGGNDWPYQVQFSDNIAEQIDLSHKLNRTYRYRVSLLNKWGAPAVYFVTPHLQLEEGQVYRNFSTEEQRTKEKENSNIKIKQFSVEIFDKKQNPILVQAKWNIEGVWDYVTISNTSTSYRVDNLHNSAILEKLTLNKKHSFVLRVFNDKNELLATSDRATIII